MMFTVNQDKMLDTLRDTLRELNYAGPAVEREVEEIYGEFFINDRLADYLADGPVVSGVELEVRHASVDRFGDYSDTELSLTMLDVLEALEMDLSNLTSMVGHDLSRMADAEPPRGERYRVIRLMASCLVALEVVYPAHSYGIGYEEE